MNRKALPRTAAAVIAAAALSLSSLAHAVEFWNPAGVYVGAELGGARTGVAVPGDLGGGEYFENRGAFQFMVGIHPAMVPLGAELTYVDLGSLGGGQYDDPYYDSGHLKLHGPAAFAVFYLPIPLIDVYLKAGGAHLDGSLQGYSPFAGGSIRNDFSGTHFAGGVGMNVPIGPVALRAEYQFFNAAGETQSMLGAGLVWTF